MFSFFGGFKTCETLQMAMLANIECWLGSLPSLKIWTRVQMFCLVTFLYLQKSGILSMLESFIFNSRGKMYQLAKYFGSLM